MKEIQTFTGRIVRKRKTLFGKCILTLSDLKHTVNAECSEGLYHCLNEGIHLTIVLYGKQLVSWTVPSTQQPAANTAIAETSAFGHGKPLYYRSSRCWNTPDIRGFNQGLLTCDEIVSYDCNLFEQLPVLYSEIEVPCSDHQYLAVIVEPSESPSAEIGQDARFTFCGYDLVEEMTQISAITNCGAAYRNAIKYESLNSLGLCDSYTEAAHTQKELRRIFPFESHADCVIVEIWRYIAQ